MSSHYDWPAGQLRHARTRTRIAVAVALAGTVTTFSGAAMAVTDTAVLGLGVALTGMVAMVAGFELIGRCVDGPRPAEAEACFAAAVPLGGRRPAGRSPAEPTIRTEVGRLNHPFTVRSRAEQEGRA